MSDTTMYANAVAEYRESWAVAGAAGNVFLVLSQGQALELIEILSAALRKTDKHICVTIPATFYPGKGIADQIVYTVPTRR